MNKTKIISVANHKGGVGKTTTVASVGVGLARKGFKVLLVDLDAQANLTSSLLEEEPPMTLYDTLIEGHELSVVHVMDNPPDTSCNKRYCYKPQKIKLLRV